MVIDEAHTLEDAATDVFGPKFSVLFLRSRLRRLHSERGKKGILARFSPRERAEFAIEPLLGRIATLGMALTRFDELSRRCDPEIDRSRKRIQDADLITPEWSELCLEADGLATRLEGLARGLLDLWRALAEVDRLAATAERIQKAALGIEEYAQWGRTIFRDAPVEGTVLWREAGHDRPLLFRRSPLDVGPTLREKLHKRFDSVLLTSATMQACGDFAFLSERLGLTRPPPPTANEDGSPVKEAPVEDDPEWTARLVEPVSAGHPFDYESRVLLGLVRRPAEKTSEEPEAILADRVGRIAEVTGGRMLALFTNRSRMLATAERLTLDGIEILAQGRDGSRHDLARRLRRRDNVLLLGTRSFWEGIDVPGENLSVVVMEKIPFVAPGEPVYEARCEAIGGKWFMRYALPLAMLALRQGFGRLIRTEEDRGIVVLLDPGKKNYAAKIRKTLPECRTVEGDFDEVLTTIREWWTAKA